MRPVIFTICICFLILSSNGCSRIQQPATYALTEQQKMQAAHHWDVPANDVASQINKALVDHDHVSTPVFVRATKQAFPTLLPRQADLPVLTTTFVNNDNLKETSRFARILQEHTTSRLVQLGYTRKELKFRDTLLMRERFGKTILSGNIGEINAKSSLSSQAILVGTYSYTNRTMYISARLINPKDRSIISSYDYRLCMDDTILAMFGLMRQPSLSGDEIDPPRTSLLDALFY